MVAVVGLRGIPDISGGIETHCEYLLPKIADAARGEQFVVVGRRPSMGTLTLRRRGNLTVVPLFAMKNRYLEAISNTFVGVLAARLRYRAKIVHLHAVGPALMAPLARLLGAKVVFTHHGDDYRRAKWNRFAQAVLKTGERVGVLASNEVIAVSSSLAERLKADYPGKASSIHYIPNGADHILDETRHETRPVDDWLADHGLVGQQYIVSVGRLVPEKGFADLIRAYAMARPSSKLVIVGGPSGSNHDKEIFDLIRSEGVTENVVLTGAIPREGVAALLSKASLFVLASHHEGLPIAALEASAMGAPILLSDIRPNLDLGLPAHHYVPVGNPAAFAARLTGPWDDLRAQTLIERFNWTRIAEETALVYRRLAE
ncbi:glycosyltransferase family 4 protein [Maritimibacter sp. DP1N21-5]|uniref:glycosyltransferase family 4 protein n=1 Tax=Maritimibacter sp. DP1N21-5 TaxID=2836867 RepID=UPI001C47DAE3|nr:glycosyltransferase family 4 protein [Maritimibacter sp. DP1N21-5]MBV7410313.1 glycosyltransferase family 4 protein [Maritimibacter sp. DP1N21-5]